MRAGLLAAVIVLSLLVSLLPAPFGGPLSRSARPDSAVAGLPLGLPWFGFGLRGARGPVRETDPAFVARDTLSGAALSLTSLLVLAVVEMVILFVLPQRMGRIAVLVSGSWRVRLRLAAVGLAGVLLALALSVLAAPTIVGPPILALLIAGGYLGLLIGLGAVCLPLGRWVGRRLGLAEQPPPVDLLTGILTLFGISLVPVLGGLVLLGAGLLGLGASIQTRLGSATPWRLQLPEMDY
jgi:hypothetical protein